MQIHRKRHSKIVAGGQPVWIARHWIGHCRGRSPRGWCPKGRRLKTACIPRAIAQETRSPAYHVRTRRTFESDGTHHFRQPPDCRGTKLTAEFAGA